MDAGLLSFFTSEIDEAITLLSDNIVALPSSTPTEATGLAIFARLASRTPAAAGKQLGGALELVWVDVDSIATAEIFIGEFGVSSILDLFQQIGARALAREGPKEARAILSWLEALTRAVGRQIDVQCSL